jgi:Holliday junction DNA helicase RuvA
MISSVRGVVLSVSGTSAVVEVGGIGLAMSVTPDHARSLHQGSEARIHTALIVREDDLSLFGFADIERLAIFDLLRGVTGVGPKSAMGVLSVMSPDDVARAVNAEDDAAFRKVSGIGPKTAKLIVLSLTGKVHETRASTSSPQRVAGDARSDLVEALVGLGWNERAAVQAADDAIEVVDPALRESVPALLRVALTSLGPAQSAGRGGGR